ncbi:MAG: Cytosolic Fe-S cluster assembly factor nar1 [Pycnora praestabilis]|nr:MAG: Cytosolic Fe-S cluster assembly factor nar1 [Pycnora praestabilis]
MSAILSANDLNDFISPGVACIKPVETLPQVKPKDPSNPYEVTTEDTLTSSENLPPAQISLTDCLACSGCVTSAEAVLVSLQSHSEVLNALDSYPSINPQRLQAQAQDGLTNGRGKEVHDDDGKIFVATVSPQTRASLAATYGVTERQAGYMIAQLLSGPQGIKNGGKYGNGFTWVLDTNVAREACLVLGADEVAQSLFTTSESTRAADEEGAATTQPKKPILTSACPGWICYAEKTHPHILPHLSRLKSPQALMGTLVKTTLSQRLGISPDRIWHVAVMPCFDKKLEASREELTNIYWKDGEEGEQGVRDVDCVITTREILMLADSRAIRFSDLPRKPLNWLDRIPFPDAQIDKFLFPQAHFDRQRTAHKAPLAGSSSGGYLFHILETHKAAYPGSQIVTERGRNLDVVDYTLMRDSEILLKTARYYGFRNIQNLVRKLKPAKNSRMPGGKLGGSRKPGAPQAKGGAASQSGAGSDYAYVEVMACPGGCTNGGGQIKVTDVDEIKGTANGDIVKNGPTEQKEWLARVDEAYFSAESSDEDVETPNVVPGNGSGQAGAEQDMINGISSTYVRSMLDHWSELTGIDLEKLVYTTYRKVESDVGKDKVNDTERIVELAGRIGGGW